MEGAGNISQNGNYKGHKFGIGNSDKMMESVKISRHRDIDHICAHPRSNSRIHHKVSKRLQENEVKGRAIQGTPGENIIF
jgi:hypothetical protein